MITSTNPSRNYEVLGQVEETTTSQVHEVIAKARKVFPAWRNLSLDERLVYARRLRDLFLAEKEALATIATQEMGQIITLSRGTVDRAVAYMDWALENAHECLKPEVSFETDVEINELVKEPHGVGACISPWNFPASNFVWACFQGVIAGNVIVFKNSEEVQLFGKKLEELINKAGFPKGVFNVIYGAAETAEALTSGDINYINFTGSTRVGQILYKKAAEKFIPATLEMGGSDPAVVFKDADLDKVIEQIYNGRFTNCGQVCVSLKRLIVHEDIHDELVSRLKDLLAIKKMGDAMNEDTDIGPLAAKRQQELLILQVEDAKAKGATLICGGNVPEHLEGAYFEPTIFTNVTKEMLIWHEEVFGPVLPIVKFVHYEDAIEKANDTVYGLGASVFTTNKELANQAIHDIKSGMIRVNETHFSKPQNPFGGTKLSGLGRENAHMGFEDVTYTRIVAREK